MPRWVLPLSLLSLALVAGPAASQRVDPARSTIAGGLTWRAGEWAQLQVQLFDELGAPAQHFYDPALTVDCLTDGLAPAGESFCTMRPVVRPIGGGRYEVSVLVGTIW